MKMKKLTALALAGVLCLGMSTTAFAVDSVTTETANANTVLKSDGQGGYEEVPDYEFKTTDGQDFYVNVDTQEINEMDITDDAKTQVAFWMTEAGEKNLKEQLATNPNCEVDDKAPIAIVKSGDISTNVSWDSLKNDDVEYLQVEIDVTDLLISDKEGKLKKGDFVNVLHWVSDDTGAGEWVYIPATLREGTGKDKGKLFAVANFDVNQKMSPFMITAQRVSGAGNDDDINNNGNNTNGNNTNGNNTNGNNTNGNNTDTAIKDGKVTIDDIANAVVAKLKASNATVVRVNRGVSPKTGE